MRPNGRDLLVFVLMAIIFVAIMRLDVYEFVMSATIAAAVETGRWFFQECRIQRSRWMSHRIARYGR